MEATVIIDEPLRNPKSNCYIVTYCYGRDTIQCHEMIQFRDQVLMKSAPGRAFIDFYYRHSPELIKIMQKSSLMSDAMKRLSKGFISCVLFAMHRRKI
ncbi:MAG TPA: CFI-box-CTERM domain-containing protein, partial [Saprospiraceae bacterium]|nr:CFI-box-CTERM domain-containing protein [Saprospiraceae bacterium]